MINLKPSPRTLSTISFILIALLTALSANAQKKPNILILMGDDTGWGDFGYMSGGGQALGHPTPNIDRLAKEGAVIYQIGTGRLVVRRAEHHL